LHYSFSRFTFAENKGAAEAAEEENKKCWLSEWSRSVGRIEMKRWQKNIISLARLFKPKIQGPNNGPMAEFEKKNLLLCKSAIAFYRAGVISNCKLRCRRIGSWIGERVSNYLFEI
jgi:hypothetical protein